MNLESYFNKLKSDFPDINLPGIFEAEDYNESQLKINGIWTNYLYGCGVIRKNDRYVYLETDQERGYISVVKEFENKESLEQYICNRFTIIANASTAERSDQAAEELYKPIVRYLRSLDEDRLLDVRQAVIQDVPSSRCDYLFDEVRRKEGFVEKLGGFFHKK